jgi:hypothetical protein
MIDLASQSPCGAHLLAAGEAPFSLDGQEYRGTQGESAVEAPFPSGGHSSRYPQMELAVAGSTSPDCQSRCGTQSRPAVRPSSLTATRWAMPKVDPPSGSFSRVGHRQCDRHSTTAAAGTIFRPRQFQDGAP